MTASPAPKNRSPRNPDSYRGARRNRILRREKQDSLATLRAEAPGVPRQQLRALLWPAPKRKVRPYLCKPDLLTFRWMLDGVWRCVKRKQRKQPRVYPYHGPVRSATWAMRAAA